MTRAGNYRKIRELQEQARELRTSTSALPNVPLTAEGRLESTPSDSREATSSPPREAIETLLPIPDQDQAGKLQSNLENSRMPARVASEQPQDVQQQESIQLSSSVLYFTSQLNEERDRVRSLSNELEVERRGAQQKSRQLSALDPVLDALEAQLAQEHSQVEKHRREFEQETEVVAELHEQIAQATTSQKLFTSPELEESTVVPLHKQIVAQDSSQELSKIRLEELHMSQLLDHVGNLENDYVVYSQQLLDQVGNLENELAMERRTSKQLRDLQEGVYTAARSALEADQVEKLQTLILSERRRLADLPEQDVSQAVVKELLLMSQLTEEKDHVGKLQSELEVESRVIQEMEDLQRQQPQLLSLHHPEEVLEAQLAQGESHIAKLRRQLKQERGAVAELQEQMVAQASSQKNFVEQLLLEVDGRAKQQMQDLQQSQEVLQAQLVHGQDELKQEREMVAELDEQMKVESYMVSQLSEERDQVGRLAFELEAEKRATHQKSRDLSSQDLVLEALEDQLAQGQSQVQMLRQQLEQERGTLVELHEQMVAQDSSQELRASWLLEEVERLQNELQAERGITEHQSELFMLQRNQSSQLLSKLAHGQSQVERLHHQLEMETRGLAELHEHTGPQAMSKKLAQGLSQVESLRHQLESESRVLADLHERMVTPASSSNLASPTSPGVGERDPLRKPAGVYTALIKSGSKNLEEQLARFVSKRNETLKNKFLPT